MAEYLKGVESVEPVDEKHHASYNRILYCTAFLFLKAKSNSINSMHTS